MRESAQTMTLKSHVLFFAMLKLRDVTLEHERFEHMFDSEGALYALRVWAQI
jgi:hypothetical protein